MSKDTVAFIIIMINIVVFMLLLVFFPKSDCSNYTLNQYESGDVPVRCLDSFSTND